MEKVEYIVGLILKHRARTLTPEEDIELERWLSESDENRSLFLDLINEDTLVKKLKVYDKIDGNAVWEKTLQQIARDSGTFPLQPVKKIAWWRYAAAAALVFAVAVIGWQYFKPRNNEPVVEKTPVAPAVEEIVPGGLKATLTLSDGKTVELDQTAGRQPIKQGDVVVSYTDGKIAYSGAPAPGSPVLYNTVTTPRGGRYQVVLPDGSKVWLNAASSLRFPIAFAGNERNVSLTGEAFFEVSAMPARPFKVSIGTPLGNGGTVEVLGTHFNIDAYGDVDLVRTTLVHGSVRLTTPTAVKKVLKPMQELVIDRKGNLGAIHTVTPETAVPWVNGQISLKGDVRGVLMEIGRWYNLTIEFKGKIPDVSLEGQIPMDLSFDKLEMVLKSQGLTFEIRSNERKLILI